MMTKFLLVSSVLALLMVFQAKALQAHREYNRQNEHRYGVNGAHSWKAGATCPVCGIVN